MRSGADQPGPLVYLEELRNRALGANPIKLLQTLNFLRGDGPPSKPEHASLTDRLVGWLHGVARKRTMKSEGGPEQLYIWAVEVKPGRCPFCRQSFSVMDYGEEGFCQDCKAAGVTDSDYSELLFRLRELRALREQSQR